MVTTGAAAFEDQFGALGLAAPLAPQHHRPATQHVGQRGRLDVVDLQSFEVRLQVGEHRRVDHAAQPLGLRRGLIRLGDDKGFALAGTRQAFDQVAVDRRADAEGEHVGLRQVAPHELEHLVLDADVAIGDDDHAARHVGRLGQRGHAAQRRHDLGAAAAAHAVDRLQRAVDVGARGRHRVVRQHAVAAGEQHHVEGVARPQAADQLAQQQLGRLQRIAVHRARDVDHEDVVARIDLRRRDGLRRLDQREEEVLGARRIRRAVQHQPGGGALARQAVLEDEVAVVARLVVAECQLHRAAAEALRLHPVRHRMHVGDRQRRVDVHVQLEAGARGHAGHEVRGGRQRAVVGRHGRRAAGRRALPGPALPSGDGHRGCPRGRHITRADDRRKHEAVGAGVGCDEFGVAQLDPHVVTGQDVGHVHREHVGPLLLEQRGGLALAPGAFVFEPCALFLADLRDDLPLAHAHRHRVHRRAGRAREDVTRLDRALAFVAVALRQRDIGDHAGDAHVDAGALQRQRVQRGVVALDVEVRALGGTRLGVVGMRRRPGDEQQRREHRDHDAGGHAADARQRPHARGNDAHDRFSSSVVRGARCRAPVWPPLCSAAAKSVRSARALCAGRVKSA